LIVSTNQQFFGRLEQEVGESLPVLRGELPNTDYPINAIGQAHELGINRLTHDMLSSAEKLAVCAHAVGEYAYPADTLAEAHDCMQLYDGHTGGMAHPMGWAQEATWAWKGELGQRAAALAHDVLIKSANRIGDHVNLQGEGHHLVVFNPLAQERTGLVRVPAVPVTPASRPMYWRHRDGTGEPPELAAGAAIGRRIVNLPVELLEAPFRLVDLATDKDVPCQVVMLDDPLAARPLSAQRWALGHVDPHSLANFNYDRAHLAELVFVAEDVPSLGYKTYRLIPSQVSSASESSLQVGETWIENRFYRIELDPESGVIASIWDKALERDWVDNQGPYGFNQLLVRSPLDGEVHLPIQSSIEIGQQGPVVASLVVRGDGRGCANRVQEITLYDTVKRVDIANRFLRDATPLLELYFAFPLEVDAPQFRLEASNSVIAPIRDQLPGTNTNAYAMQHWVAVWDEAGGATWASLEAPVVELGGLWPSPVSQAHHGVTPPGYGDGFLRDPAQLKKGHIFSYVMANNSRTNAQTVQVADVLFRYSLTTHQAGWREGRSHDFGWGVATPLEPICLQGPQVGALPESSSFCRVDRSNVHLLTMKGAEDGDGLILRLAENEGQPTTVTVTLPQFEIGQAFGTDLVEVNQRVLTHDRHSVRVPLKAWGLATVRCRGLRFPPVALGARF
jgi:hypothetical protein